MNHDPNCSGCPICRADYGAMLNETPEVAARRLSAETRAMMRAAMATTVTRTPSEWRDYFGQRLRGYGSVVTDTPNPYAKATDKMPCPFDDPNYDPHGAAPDGYTSGLAVERARKESR